MRAGHGPATIAPSDDGASMPEGQSAAEIGKEIAEHRERHEWIAGLPNVPGPPSVRPPDQ